MVTSLSSVQVLQVLFLTEGRDGPVLPVGQLEQHLGRRMDAAVVQVYKLSLCTDRLCIKEAVRYQHAMNREDRETDVWSSLTG